MAISGWGWIVSFSANAIPAKRPYLGLSRVVVMCDGAYHKRQEGLLASALALSLSLLPDAGNADEGTDADSNNTKSIADKSISEVIFMILLENYCYHSGSGGFTINLLFPKWIGDGLWSSWVHSFFALNARREDERKDWRVRGRRVRVDRAFPVLSGEYRLTVADSVPAREYVLEGTKVVLCLSLTDGLLKFIHHKKYTNKQPPFIQYKLTST